MTDHNIDGDAGIDERESNESMSVSRREMERRKLPSRKRKQLRTVRNQEVDL